MDAQQAREQLDNDTKKLYKKAIELTRIQRKQLVNEIIENYFEVVGKYPDKYRLEKLANVLLVEEIKDQHAYKMRKSEYGFLSERQIKTRAGKEIYIDDDQTLNFLYQKNVKKMDSAFKKRTSEGSLND